MASNLENTPAGTFIATAIGNARNQNPNWNAPSNITNFKNEFKQVMATNGIRAADLTAPIYNATINAMIQQGFVMNPNPRAP
jgi:hypothetical protein